MGLTKIDDRGLKTPIDLLDNEKIRLGTGNDLELYHDASHSRLVNGTGNLLLDNSNGTDMYLNSGNDIYIRPQGSENGIKVIGDAAVELYYDDSKKLETTSSGATISGANPVLELAGTANTSGNTFLHINANANHWCVGADNYSSQNLFVIKDGTPSSSTHRFAIDASGRIGIGTTSPGSFDGSADDLVINGSGNTGITINSGAASSTSEGNLVFAEGNGSGGSADEWRGVIQYKHGDDYMRFLTDNSERMRIDSSGKVSVGGETPIYNFNVRGSGQQVLLIGSTNAGGAYLTLDGDSNGDGQSGDYCSIGHTTAGNLEIIADNPNGDANVIISSGNAAEALRINGSQRVGIGTSSPETGAKLTISGQGLTVKGQNTAHTTNGLAIGQEGSGVAQLRAYGSDSTSYGEVDIQLSTNNGTSSNSNFKFIKLSSGSSVLKIPTNGGIQFPSYDESTSDGNSVSTNTLDDYEEGTFTPQFLINGLETGISYNGRGAAYIKIGSLVFVRGSVSLSSIGSGSGSASIGNLPFTIRNDYASSSQEGFGMLTYWAGTNSTSNFIFWASENGTTATIQRINGASTVANADQNDFNNTSDLRFSLIYTAN